MEAPQFLEEGGEKLKYDPSDTTHTLKRARYHPLNDNDTVRHELHGLWW